MSEATQSDSKDTESEASSAGEATSKPAETKPSGAAPPGDNEETDRRTALRAFVTVGALAYAGALCVPALGFLNATGGADSGGGQKPLRWVRVGRLSDVPKTGEPKRLPVIADERDAFTVTRNQLLGAVWLVREGDDKVRAMSSVCPHLGCAIDINPDKKSFNCPCHASRFSLAGAPEAGPSPRNMDALETRIVDGQWVEVAFKRFKQGIKEQEEVMV